MTGVIVFDLDDTLYLERDYVHSGFLAVGAWLHREHGIDGFADAAWRRFAAGTRGTIFDASLADLGVSPAPGFVAGLVHVYRHHVPAIALQPDAAAWLSAPPPGMALALLTDGPVASQRRKIRALGLDTDRLWPQVLSDDWGSEYRKPHVRGFRHIEQMCGAAGHRCVYVGDNAAKDFLGARGLGWRTVQIVRAGALHAGPPATPAHAADAVITSFSELDGVLHRNSAIDVSRDLVLSCTSP